MCVPADDDQGVHIGEYSVDICSGNRTVHCRLNIGCSVVFLHLLNQRPIEGVQYHLQKEPRARHNPLE